jgi:molecular chaperone GrpE (heat shock protein)
MREPTGLRLAKWPFFLGDILLLVAAYFICSRSPLPLGAGPGGLLVVCVAAGAGLGILPFVLQHRARVKLAEAGELTTVIAQIKNVETVAAQISGATSRWQAAQEEASKVAGAARGIAERMGAEVQAFAEFMQRMNDSEKATLRLEAEKLRRAETDWLQVLVRLLDHVYALHMGALRSGQPQLIDQLTSFQNACRDAVRRVGLTPFVGEPSEPFDGQRHRVLDGEDNPPAEARIFETVATGYTFQGRLLRPALVRLQNGELPKLPVKPDSDSSGPESQLSLLSSCANAE